MPGADAALRVEVQTSVASVQAGMDQVAAVTTEGAESFRALETAGTESLAGIQTQLAATTAKAATLDATLAESKGAKLLQGNFTGLAGKTKQAAEGLEKASVSGGLLSGSMGIMGGAVGIAAGAVLGLGEHFANLVEQERNQATASGMSIVQYDELSQTFQAAGIKARTLTRAFPQLAANIQLAIEGSKEQSLAFRDLGLSSDYLKKHQTDTNAVLMTLADHLKKTGVDASTAADLYRLFGGRGAQLAAVLEKGSVSLRQMEASFHGHAVAVSEASDAAEKFHLIEAQVVTQIEAGLLPAFKVLPPIIATVGTAFTGLKFAVSTVFRVLQSGATNVVLGLEGIGHVVWDVIHGDLAKAKADYAQMNQAIVANQVDTQHALVASAKSTFATIKQEWGEALAPAAKTVNPFAVAQHHVEETSGKHHKQTTKARATQGKALQHWIALRKQDYNKEFMDQLEAERKQAEAQKKAHAKQLAELQGWLLKRHESYDKAFMDSEALRQRADAKEVQQQQRKSTQLAGQLQTALMTRYGLRNLFAKKVNSLIQTEMATGLRLGASFLAQKLGLDLQEKKSSASTAAADAGKSVASTPIVGAFLAPVTPASVFSELMSFDRGGLVPHTSLAMVHKNEMVLPREIADTVRNAAHSATPAPGHAGATHLHYTANVQALDGDGVAEIMRRHGADVAASLQRWYRGKNQM